VVRGGWRRSRKCGHVEGSWRRENIHQFMRKKKTIKAPHASSPLGRRHRHRPLCCRRLARCRGAAGEAPDCSGSSAGGSGMRDAGCGSRVAWLGGWEIEWSGLVGSPRSPPRLVRAAGVIARLIWFMPCGTPARVLAPNRTREIRWGTAVAVANHVRPACFGLRSFSQNKWLLICSSGEPTATEKKISVNRYSVCTMLL
jgi:hypothetical protein